MPDLPRPRCREESMAEYAIALQRCCEYAARGKAIPAEIAAIAPHHAAMLNARLAAVPPVSGMPELAEPWAVVGIDGRIWSYNDSRDEAVEYARKSGEALAVRLAVVGVVEPEPEVAPSGWRYTRLEGGIVRQTDHTGGTRLIYTVTSENVPPIDLEYVARLLAIRKEGDAT